MTLNLLNQQAGAISDVQARRTIIVEVIDAVNREFAGKLSAAEREAVSVRIHSLVTLAYRNRSLVALPGEQENLAEEVIHRVLGWGFLDMLLPPARTDLSEITIYSSGLIQIMPKGEVRWRNVGIQVEAGEVWRVLNVLLGPQSKAVTEATPSIEAKLPPTEHNPGGGRISVAHPVIAPGKGYPSVNIRLYEQKPVKPEWLLERQVMSAAMMAYLGESMKKGEHILICGATRTGKTTLLSALCNFLPEGWRIVKIEDPEEIWIDRPTVQTLEARAVPPGAEIAPFTLANGVDKAMRMSPDYLIVGEVRDGAAAMALFRALTTGHSGSCTLHADSPTDALLRLRHLMREDRGVSDSYAAETVTRGIDLMVQLGIRREMRRVTGITRLRKKMDGRFGYTYVWRFDEESDPDEPRWREVGPGDPSGSVVVGEEK